MHIRRSLALHAALVIALAATACSAEPEVVGAGSTDTRPTTTTAATTTTTTTTAEPTTTTSTVAPPTTTTTSTTTTTTTTTAAPTTTSTTTTTTAAPTTTTTAAPTTTTAAPTTTTATIDYVALGSQLATDLGCRVCHSTDGSAALGPTWAGLAGSTVALSDGSTVTATAGYLQESILAPDAKIVAGYSAGVMQNNYGGLSADELTALVAYISSR